MKITRKPWIKTLRQLAKLYPSSQTVIHMQEEGIAVCEAHMRVFLPYPNAAKFPIGSIGMIDLLRALTPLTESSVNVFPAEQALKLQEEFVTIRIPHKTLEQGGFPVDSIGKSPETHRLVVRELPSALQALRAAIGGARSSGMADYIYWEGSRLYSFNGTMLGIAEFSRCPVERILIPKNIADFMTGLETDDLTCEVVVHKDKSITLNFEGLGELTYTQPEVASPKWSELIPKDPERWLPVPTLFFRLPQVALSLADRHHSKIKISWKDKKITAEGSGEYALQFSLDEDIGIYGNKSGVLDILALSPILSYAQRMGWGEDYLMFSSHIFKFYCMLETQA